MSDWIHHHRNNKGWRSASAWRLFKVALRRWIKALAWDFTDLIRFGLLKQHLKAKPAPPEKSAALSVPVAPSPAPSPKPVIFASYAVDQKWTGSHRYCGGEKVLNALINLLRLRGYEAYLVTLDGRQAGWLAEDAPVISVEEFKSIKARALAHRCVTSWIDAHAFLDGCDSFYYWDMELATSSDYQFPRLWDYVASGRVKNIAVLNRAAQAWFQTVLGRSCPVIPCMVDSRHWQPAEEKRVSFRVGYMDEGPHTEALVEAVRARTLADGLTLDFHKIFGDEPKVIAQMQSCEIFLVTNPGKSAIWGEGGPLGPYESAACGTVSVSFDLLGPWESIQQNYNGIVVPRGRTDLFAQAVSSIYL
jgi:glycosyltransferase involved in cell wall biosynthesis